MENLANFLTAHLNSFDATTPPDVVLSQQMRHPTGYICPQGSVSTSTCPIIPIQEFRSESPFSTVLYPTPVTMTGKWMFEAIVSTPGIMQVGWTAVGCKWTDEKGIGDFFNSYGYDGKRLKVFANFDSRNYGVRWVSGDVIGCCIDLDGGTITYYSNGKSLGTLPVSIDRSLNYVPGISIMSNEKAILNIGDYPFM